MTIDWDLALKVSLPIATLFLGAWINRWFERRPALTSYFGHVSSHTHTMDDGKKASIYSHTAILRNSGRKAATNVRLTHRVLPSYDIFPPMIHSVETLPDDSKQIVIPVMVPGEQITVSYLYFPPLTAGGANAGIKCDDGFAKELPVLLQRQYPRWLNTLAAALMLVGLATVAYLAFVLVRHLAQ